jgi:molecular chaperone HscA
VHLLDIHEPGETPRPHQNDVAAVGIDLGTTNSLVAVSTHEKPEIVRGVEGATLLPSVVAYLEDGRTLVGGEARSNLLEDPDSVVSSIKRLMGRGAEDVKTLAGNLPYDLEPAKEGGLVRVRVGGRSRTPVEISGHILSALRHRAERALGHDVEQAVVTVPAYFDDAARSATKDAARLAGLEVLRLVNEPTAAALAYGLDNEAEGVYAIYDLGGGTFDISVLKMQKGVFQVLATGGDAALGGDDFDHAVAEHLLAERAKELGEAELNIGEVKRALATARLAKECLSSQSEGKWVLDVDDQLSHHTLTVETFENLIDAMVERTTDVCKSVLADAEVTPAQVKGIVLVGGSTRVPLVRRRVEEMFGKAPLTGIDPDHVVALGAALQAEALTRGSDTLLLDVTPLSLGIETMGSLVEKVIPRNTSIPVSKAQEFTTYEDGQTAMSIQVLQGEREMAGDNRSLAHFELQGIPPMAAGAARIRVTFTVDADGLLTVSAKEATTGIEQVVEVKPSYGLSDDEMATMLREAMKHGREDMAWRMVAESRVEAERIAGAVRAAMASDGDLLNDKETHVLETALAGVATAVEGDDREAIETASKDLDAASQDLAARRMERGIETALKGAEVDDLAERIGDDGA